MKNNRTDLLQKAKNYAFLLLKFRLRSEKEIYARLKKKRFEEAVIKKTIVFLKNSGFINDTYFTRLWIESRLKRPFGLRRIKEELRLKGVDKDTIDLEINALKDSYSEENTVKRVVQEKLYNLKNLDPNKMKRRLFSYLVRRGFSVDMAIDAIRQL